MTRYPKTECEQVNLFLTWLVTPHADVLPGWSQILRAARNEVNHLVPRNPHSSRVADISLPGPDVDSDVQTHDLLALPLGHDRPGEGRTSLLHLAGWAELLLTCTSSWPTDHPWTAGSWSWCSSSSSQEPKGAAPTSAYPRPPPCREPGTNTARSS